MSGDVSTQRRVPNTGDFTSSPLRNRVRVELDAPVSEVWGLLGDLSRFPEYSSGLERVDAVVDSDGRCVEYTCFFKPFADGAEGAVSRDVMKWYEPDRGYLSVEVASSWGGGGTVALTTLEPIPAGRLVSFDTHFDADDLDAATAHLDEALVDIAKNLIARFGGRVTEHYVEREYRRARRPTRRAGPASRSGRPRRLSELVREIQHPMYRLALRFLGNPDDAEDACQEILIRIVTRLGTFEGRSKFSTWVYTVAVRSLLRTRKRLYESAVPGGLTDAAGSEILDCSREAFRQRVSRARRTIRFVIDNRCGLVDPANPCRCARQVASGEAAGILDRRRLPLARHPRVETRVWIEPVARQLDTVSAIGDLYRFDRFVAPAKLWDDLRARFPELLNAA